MDGNAKGHLAESTESEIKFVKRSRPAGLISKPLTASPVNNVISAAADDAKIKLSSNIDSKAPPKKENIRISTELAFQSTFASESKLRNLTTQKTNAGPKPAPLASMRHTSRMDYAQDVCKDWMETGYCVFGDTCKFMHVRDESKPSWQLDAEWEAEQESKRRKSLKDDFSRQNENASAVIKCKICGKEDRGQLVRPEECKDIFCQKCILTAFKKSQKCPACKNSLSGSFSKIINNSGTRSNKLSSSATAE